MAEERIFLDENNMYISNTKVVLHGTTYATANITSVSKRFTPASKGCAIALIVLGAFMTLGSLGAINSKEPGTGIILFLICAAIVAIGVLWFRSLKPTFHVMLASASGEREGMSSKDHSLVQRVVDAITNAITHRG